MIFYEKKHKETGKEYAYRVLKDNIMCLELKPGELLSESDLSEKLNISRTPIREVIMRLKGEHLIEVKPQAGTYVSLIDKEIIEEAIFMRRLLEKEVLKEACIKFSEEINDNTNEMYLFFYYNKDLNSFAYGRLFPNQIEKKEVFEILKSISFK